MTIIYAEEYFDEKVIIQLLNIIISLYYDMEHLQGTICDNYGTQTAFIGRDNFFWPNNGFSSGSLHYATFSYQTVQLSLNLASIITVKAFLLAWDLI